MNEVNVDTLFQIIGQQQVELVVLRNRVEQLLARLSESGGAVSAAVGGSPADE